MQTEPIPTSDLADKYDTQLRVCELQMWDFGGNISFAGSITTIRCFQDNGLVKSILNEPGQGRVLVVDGGASLKTALCGDQIAGVAAENSWAGIVINGAIRDSAALAELPLGVKALATTPRKSAKAGTGAADVPLVFGGITWNSGDVLHADSDGIVLLPAS